MVGGRPHVLRRLYGSKHARQEKDCFQAVLEVFHLRYKIRKAFTKQILISFNICRNARECVGDAENRNGTIGGKVDSHSLGGTLAQHRWASNRFGGLRIGKK